MYCHWPDLLVGEFVAHRCQDQAIHYSGVDHHSNFVVTLSSIPFSYTSSLTTNKTTAMNIHIHVHHSETDIATDFQIDKYYKEFTCKLDKIIEYLIINNHKQTKIMTDLSVITQEVQENASVMQSAITLLQALKTKLDEAGTDPVALKALSDSLDQNTNALAQAITANTPAETPVL